MAEPTSGRTHKDLARRPVRRMGRRDHPRDEPRRPLCLERVRGHPLLRDARRPGRSSALADHMRRLQDSCRIYRMPLRHDLETLVQAAMDTVRGERAASLLPASDRRSYGGADGRVRRSMCRSRRSSSPGIGVAIWASDALKHGVDVCVSSWRRAAPDTFPGLAKASGNYLSSQLSKMEARLDRYSEGIMLDSRSGTCRKAAARICSS